MTQDEKGRGLGRKKKPRKPGRDRLWMAQMDVRIAVAKMDFCDDGSLALSVANIHRGEVVMDKAMALARMVTDLLEARKS